MKNVLWICLTFTAIALIAGAPSDVGAPLLIVDCVVLIAYLIMARRKRKPARKKYKPMKKSRVCFILSFICVLLLIVLANYQDYTGTDMSESAAIVCFVLFFVLLPAGFVFRYREKRKVLTPEEKAAKRQERLERWEETTERWKLESTIVSTAIVGGTTIGKQKSSVTSSFVRGAVGGAVFGPVGMIAGAVTPKKKIVTKGGTVTFSVLYAAGNRSIETVKVGSKRYNELARYLA